MEAAAVGAIEPGCRERIQLLEERYPQAADRILAGAQGELAHPDGEPRGGERHTEDRGTRESESSDVVVGNVLVEGTADEEADHDEQTGLHERGRDAQKQSSPRAVQEGQERLLLIALGYSAVTALLATNRVRRHSHHP